MTQDVNRLPPLRTSKGSSVHLIPKSVSSPDMKFPACFIKGTSTFSSWLIWNLSVLVLYFWKGESQTLLKNIALTISMTRSGVSKAVKIIITERRMSLFECLDCVNKSLEKPDRAILWDNYKPWTWVRGRRNTHAGAK